MRRALVAAAVCGLVAACPAPELPPPPPGAPSLSIDEADGGSAGLFHLRGEASGAAAVRLFASALCHGLPLAVVSREAFAGGVEVEAVPGPNVFTAHAVGPTGLVSACSAPTRATFVVVGAVDAPTLRTLDPPSPSMQTHVIVEGSAPPGCSTVALTVNGCAADPVVTVSAAALEQGVGLDVPQGSVSAIVATCADPTLARPPCSNTLLFVSAPVTLPSPTWFTLSPSSPSSDPDPLLFVELSLANGVEVFDGPCDGGVSVGSFLGGPSSSNYPSVTVPVRLSLSGAAQVAELWVQTSDEAGDRSFCTRGPSYEVDPTLPPRPTRTFVWIQSDAASLQVDAQRGSEVDVFFRHSCVAPADAVVLSLGRPETVFIPLQEPDGGRLTEASVQTIFDGGVSPCQSLSLR